MNNKKTNKIYAPYPVRLPRETNFYTNIFQKVGFTFTEKQKDIIEYTNGRSQILATAGSGKTTTITAKIGWMALEAGISASKILAMSYSKASAKDFKARYNTMFSDLEIQGVDFMTLHAFAYKVVREQYRRQGKQLMLIEGAKSPVDKMKFLSETYFKLNRKYMTAEQMNTLTTDIGYVKNMMIPLKKHKSKIGSFEAIFESYEAMKRDNNFIDFDDMLSECHRFLSENREICIGYSKRYTHLLLDEAQDISPVQAEIGKLLSREFGNITLIGDDDQSIYGFRAADPSFLIEYSNKFMDTVVFDLGINYRCAPNILEHAKHLISYNAIRLDKDMHANKTEDGIFELIPYGSAQEQYDTILKKIKKMDEHQLNDSAILFRNNISAIPFIDMLYENNIPFYVKDDKIGFFNEWLVKDIVNILMFTQNQNNLELFRKVNSRLGFYLNDDVFRNLDVGEGTLLERLYGSDLVPANQRYRLKMAVTTFKEFKFQSVKQAINFVIDQSGYGEYIKSRDKKGDYGSQSSKQVIEIMTYLGRNMDSINGYYNRLRGIRSFVSEMSKTKRSKGVSLITLHGSKGLEFETVFMVDLVEDLFPSKSACKDMKLLEEERRLCFVGVTRAKTNAYICYDKKAESQFIKELKTKYSKSAANTYQGHLGKPTIKKPLKNELLVNGTLGLLISNVDQLKLGTCVVHQVFGLGKVSRIDGSIVIVTFEEAIEKSLSTDFVIQNGILRLVAEG